MDPDLPTTPGRRRALRPVPSRTDARAAPRVGALYPRFTVLNGEVLELCTAWQVRVVGGRTLPNDHLDERHDRRTIARLVALHRRASPLIEELGSILGRFHCYRSRLDLARRRVQAGEYDWFTRPGIDSYHTVWFELHEDLLTVLGRSRTDRPPDPPVPVDGGGPDHLQEQP